MRPQKVVSLIRAIAGEKIEGEDKLDGAAREVLEGLTCFSRFVCPSKLMDKDAMNDGDGDDGGGGVKHKGGSTDAPYTFDDKYDGDDEAYLAMLNLYYAISLHAALCLPPRSEGIDLVIPVVLQNGRLGSINVQVKSLSRRLCASVRREIVRKIKGTYFSTRRSSLNICINLSDHDDQVPPSVQEGVVFVDGVRNSFHDLWHHYPKLLEMVLEFTATGRFRELCQGEETIRKEAMSAMAAPTFFETFPRPKREEEEGGVK
jgi:hypothetical protein